MYKLLLTLLIAISISACSTTVPNYTQTEPSDNNIQTVKKFINAFNERNLEGMLATVSNDVQWLSIDGNEISTVTNDKAELSKTLQDYFKECETCRSSVKNIISDSERVSVTEVASWESKDGPKSQSSLSVYEIENGLIKRVYYFPVNSEN